MKTLAILGSTGSIGKSALNVFKKNKNNFKLVYISGNKNFNLLNIQISKFKPENFFLFDYKKNNKIKNKKKVLNFENFLKKYLKNKIDYVVSGISGYNSLSINFELLKISKNILLANKETIICGGKIFLDQARKLNCNILPIDSEHHCVDFFLKKNYKTDNIKNVKLIASGGPFLNKKIKYNEKISNVIKHPNWKMGAKISVDSSTLANKVLELFEAKFLFNLKPNQCDILIESTSTVHSIVTLCNNLHFLIAHKPNMEIPISNCLNVQNNISIKKNFSLLKFNNVDFKKFPLVKLGFDILNSNHHDMILFTVLNERLVNMYLNNEILYGDIVKRLFKFFYSNKNNKIVFNKKKCIKTRSDIIKLLNFAKIIKL